MQLVCAIEQLIIITCQQWKNNKLAHTLKETDAEFGHKLNVYALTFKFMHVSCMFFG